MLMVIYLPIQISLGLRYHNLVRKEQAQSQEHCCTMLSFDVLNRVKHIGSGYPGKPFWYDQNMACSTLFVI